MVSEVEDPRYMRFTHLVYVSTHPHYLASRGRNPFIEAIRSWVHEYCRLEKLQGMFNQVHTVDTGVLYVQMTVFLVGLK